MAALVSSELSISQQVALMNTLHDIVERIQTSKEWLAQMSLKVLSELDILSFSYLLLPLPASLMLVVWSSLQEFVWRVSETLLFIFWKALSLVFFISNWKEKWTFFLFLKRPLLVISLCALIRKYMWYIVNIVHILSPACVTETVS